MASSFTTYYINAPNFSNATTIYTDAALTNTAPDGVYQFDGTRRTLTAGVLGSIFFCSSCCAGCSSSYIYNIPGTKNQYYEVCIDAGKSTGTALVAKFKFASNTPQYLGFPIGMGSLYNGGIDVGVVSNRFGYLPEFYSGYTDGAGAVVSAADLVADNPYTLDRNVWQPTTSTFTASSAVQSTSILLGAINLTANNPDECYMLIPKGTAQTATYSIYSPHRIIDPNAGGCELTVACPYALPPVRVTTAQANVADACTAAGSEEMGSYYVMRVNSTTGNPKVFDRIYQDSGGATLAGAGYYGMINSTTGAASAYSVMRVDSDGIVQAVIICAQGAYPALTEMTSSQQRLVAILACLYQNALGTNLPDQQYWHNGASDAPIVGDFVYSDPLSTTVLPDGFYQLTREYIVIGVSGGLGEITSIGNCT
jgi:hypothetical protein